MDTLKKYALFDYEALSLLYNYLVSFFHSTGTVHATIHDGIQDSQTHGSCTGPPKLRNHRPNNQFHQSIYGDCRVRERQVRRDLPFTPDKVEREL